MEEIKVGDYIRTNSGTIAKLKRIEFDKVDKDLKWYFYDKKEPDINIVKEWCVNKPRIFKYSLNIIDLIEIGDYVNGRKVKRKFLDIFTKKKRLEVEGTEINWQGDMSTIYYEIEDIKSIVTKELFNKMQYVIEE